MLERVEHPSKGRLHEDSPWQSWEIYVESRNLYWNFLSQCNDSYFTLKTKDDMLFSVCTTIRIESKIVYCIEKIEDMEMNLTF